MLTDKHISQFAGYLLEEFDRWREIEAIMRILPELDEMFIAMYKKGYEDCMYENEIEEIK